MQDPTKISYPSGAATALMNEDYTLSQDLESALRYWWIMVVFILAGVAAGWLLNRANPAIYEARAEIAIDVDLSRTGTLTGENQDILINSAGKVINSASVMAALQAHLAKKGVQVSQAELNHMAVLERKADSFALRVQSPDAGAALELADYWSQLAMTALQEATQHAIQADVLMRYLDGLSNCVQQVPAAGSAPDCAIANLADLQAQISRSESAILTEREDARGLVPGLVYSLNQPAHLLPAPVQNKRNFFLLGGAGIGLVIALWILHLGLPQRWLRNKPGD